MATISPRPHAIEPCRSGMPSMEDASTPIAAIAIIYSRWHGLLMGRALLLAILAGLYMFGMFLRGVPQPPQGAINPSLFIPRMALPLRMPQCMFVLCGVLPGRVMVATSLRGEILAIARCASGMWIVEKHWSSTTGSIASLLWAGR